MSGWCLGQRLPSLVVVCAGIVEIVITFRTAMVVNDSNGFSYLNTGKWVLYTLELHSPVTYYSGNWSPMGGGAMY